MWQFCAIVLVFVLTGTHALADECGAMLRQHLATDMSLSYEEFDQTPGKGFRVLAIAGCNAEAASLIQAYIATNDAPQKSLRWHIAQLSASAGDYQTAISSARQVTSNSRSPVHF